MGRPAVAARPHDRRPAQGAVWLRRINERPATKESWKLGRNFTADRLTHLDRKPAAAE